MTAAAEAAAAMEFTMACKAFWAIAVAPSSDAASPAEELVVAR